MSNDVAKKQTTDLSVVPTGSWGAENTSSRDLILPKILLMQGLSGFVNDEAMGAKVGEMRDSLEGKLLGTRDKPLHFIPFFFEKAWVNMEKRNGKFEFVDVEPRNESNEDREWEEKVGGKELRHDKTINVYVLLPSEIELGGFLPYQLSFRRMNFKAGRTLSTLVEKLKEFDLAPAQRVFSLSCHMAENDKGKFYVYDIAQVGETKKEHVAEAYKWYKRVTGGGVKVDNSDLEKEGTEEASVADNKEF